MLTLVGLQFDDSNDSVTADFYQNYGLLKFNVATGGQGYVKYARNSPSIHSAAS